MPTHYLFLHTCFKRLQWDTIQSRSDLIKSFSQATHETQCCKRQDNLYALFRKGDITYSHFHCNNTHKNANFILFEDLYRFYTNVLGSQRLEFIFHTILSCLSHRLIRYSKMECVNIYANPINYSKTNIKESSLAEIHK